MPTYTYECGTCRKLFTKFSTMREHRNTSECECGSIAGQIIVAPPMMIIPQDFYYESPIDGRPITNRKQRLEDMARSGCVEYDPGVKQDYQRRIEQGERDLERAIDETVDRELELMPLIKKERLVEEMKAGFDLETVRG